MRIAIGDIHGRDFWKKYRDEDASEFYFLGDYFDSFDLPAVTQIRNFRKIVKWARMDERVHLCLGNHDFHYLEGCETERYSGYQPHASWDIQRVLEDAMDIIQPVYVTEDNIIISHAGVTKTFLSECNLLYHIDINMRFKTHRCCLGWAGFDSYGDSVHDGCLWVRPRSLLKDKLDNYQQIVGHTHMDKIETIDGVTFCDVDGKDAYRF